jgi:hypothetical protein
MEGYAFGETPIEMTARSSQRATPAELVGIANQIWKRIGDSGVDAEDGPGCEKILEQMHAEFKDFSISFPLVLRWMVQLRKYSAKAFEKYLLRHATATLDSRQSFLELQAEYLVLLFREEHLHPDEGAVRRYRTAIVEQLLEEDRTFMDLQKKVEKDLEKMASDIDQDRRRALYEYILAQKVASEKSLSN